MKISKIIKVTFSFTTFVTLLFTLAGCAGDTNQETSAAQVEQSEKSADEKQEVSVVFIEADVTNPYYTAMTDGANAAVADFKAEGINVTCNIIGTTSDTQSAEQLVMLEDAIVQKPDVICLCPCNTEALVSGVVKANTAGIPLINIDSRLDADVLAEADASILTFIGSDNYDGAVVAAKKMGEALADIKDAKIAILEGVSGQTNATLRRDGFMDTLPEFSNIDIVAQQPADWSRDKGYSVTQNIIQANSDIDGILAANDEMALGAVRALKDVGMLDQVTVIGFDATDDAVDAVIAGEMYATMAQSPYQMGYDAISTAVKAATEGTENIEKEYGIKVEAVTAENVQEFKDN